MGGEHEENHEGKMCIKAVVCVCDFNFGYFFVTEDPKEA
jgi:hypothetical protein